MFAKGDRPCTYSPVLRRNHRIGHHLARVVIRRREYGCTGRHSGEILECDTSAGAKDLYHSRDVNVVADEHTWLSRANHREAIDSDIVSDVHMARIEDDH